MEIDDDVQSSAADPIAAVYRDRSTRFAREASRLTRHAQIVSIGRRVAFCAAVGCLVLASSNPAARTAALVGCGLLLGGWAASIVLHDRLRHRREHYRELCKINEHSLACMSRSWEEIPLTPAEAPENQTTLAEDLELFGWGSLFHLVCRAHTPMGVATLRDWLLNPAEPPVIIERQRAVAELSPGLELRQALELHGRMLEGSPRLFLDWTEARPWLAGRPWVGRPSIALGILPSFLVALTPVGLIPREAGMAAVFFACIVNLLFTATFSGQVHEIFRKASSRHTGVRAYVACFDLMARMPGTSNPLARLRHIAGDRQHGACARLQDLRRILALGNMGADPFFKLLIYLPLQVFFLWDFHFLRLTERWQRRWSEHARRWFQALGELEALSSLAALAHDNPDWPFPTVEVRAPKGIEALELGHPHLPEQVRVPNDVAVGPPGTFLFVTGSNMSGKTTLLRALGTNIVLAQAGAPVCAVRLRMSPLVLATDMRVHDSLVEGVSMFMSALYQLKQAVDAARRLSGRPDLTLIYLLDEVLRGTNSLERQVASRKVLGRLLDEGAIGAITSHDLDLVSTDRLAEACVVVHFRESIESGPRGPRMTFDYKMHAGMATSTNALRLIKLAGLD